MSDTTTQQAGPLPEFDPETQERLRLMAAAAEQQDQARAAAGLPTRILRDVWGGIREAPLQVLRGGAEALDAAALGLRSLVGATGLVSEEFMERNPATRVADALPEPQTVTGGMVNDVAQFVAGFVPAGRLLKSLGWGVQITRGGQVARAAVQGAIADATVFDPHEERLSNLIESYPALSNPVTRFLAADPNDTEAEGRFKNAIEGLGLGAVAEGLLHALRAIRARRAGNLNEAADAADRAGTPPRDPAEELAQDNARPDAPEGGREQVQSTAPETRGRVQADGNIRWVEIKDDAGNSIGRVEGEDRPDGTFRIRGADLDEAHRGKGHGRRAYQALIDDALARGREVHSDGEVSEDAARVYASLERRGYRVERAEGTTLKDGVWTAEGGAPVFRVTAAPEQPELPLEGGSSPRPDSPAANVRENPTADQLAGPTPARRLIEVDDNGLRDLVQQRIRELGFGGGRSISGIRTDLIENGEDIASILNSLRVVYREEFDRAIGGRSGEPGAPVRSLEETRKNADRLADVLAADPDLFWQRMVSIHGISQHLDAELLVYRDLLTTVGEKLYRLAEAVNDPLGTATAGYANRLELMNQFRRHWELHANIVAAYKGIQTNVARALNAMRLPSRVDPALLRHGADAFFEGGEEGVRRMAARIVATGGDTGAITRAVRGGWLRNVVGVVNEYWINSILSGVKTHAVNIMSNAATTALQPAERMIAGAMRAFDETGRREFSEGALQYLMMAHSLRDAFRLAGRALRQGDTLIDPGHLPVEQRAWITAERFAGTDPVSPLVVNGLGTLVRLPSRLLMAEDEFFKQLTYRSRIRAAAWREGVAQGLRGDQLAEFVQKRLEGSFDEFGRATDELHLRAAREITFSSDLRASTWAGGPTLGETLQRVTANHPMLTLVLPFIRTPTNIVRFVWDRTPGLNLLRRQYLEELTGKHGPEAQGLARARMATGAAMWATAITMAMEGDITGGGPADPHARRQLMATGWRPYSIRVRREDGTVEYRAFDRLDPFGMFFGLAADFAEIGGFLGEREREQVATDLMVALARNFQSKTYLSGLTRALGALSEPEKRGERFLYGVVGSFVPTFLAQQLRDDPYMREVRSILDALRARTPGYSMDVDPVRNILGEPVLVPPGWGPEWLSPIATSTHPGGAQPITPEWRSTVQDNVHDEIARQLIIHGTSLRPPPPEYGQVDLRQFRSPVTGRTAYDRWQDLTGTVQVNGRTLREALDELIHSPAYRDVATDGTFDHDGSRVDLIRRVIGAFRLAAQAELLREIPELDAAMRQERFRRAQTKVNR